MRQLGLALALAACAAAAQAQDLKPALAGVGFLLGDWSSGEGVVADTGARSRGSSRFTIAANGAVILRQDRTELLDRTGRPAGGFEQIMMIYPEAGGLHADYSDGDHLIHYTRAEVTPGRAVAFSSAAAPGAPVFRLSYTLTGPGDLAVSFGMVPPGSSALRPIATGVLHKAR